MRVNGTNMFDAAAGFGGYRESGFGREGGREGMYEYLKIQQPAASMQGTPETSTAIANVEQNGQLYHTDAMPALDRTPKLYIGGKQARPGFGL